MKETLMIVSDRIVSDRIVSYPHPGGVPTSTVPTSPGDPLFSKWGPDGDPIFSEMGT